MMLVKGTVCTIHTQRGEEIKYQIKREEERARVRVRGGASRWRELILTAQKIDREYIRVKMKKALNGKLPMSYVRRCHYWYHHDLCHDQFSECIDSYPRILFPLFRDMSKHRL